MLQTVIGLILMIIPLFLAFFFKDRIKGFLFVVAGFIIFHFSLAIFTQSLNIFSYELIISINSIVALLSLLILIVKKNLINKTIFKINWLAVFAFLIIGFQFWSVHYSFTGTISTLAGYKEVTNNSYIYPYYSDEWIGISLINYSIENKTLPLANPLWPDTRFANPTFPFFSFFSEIFLLLKLNPLTTYPIFAIISGTLICFLAYLILRKLGVGKPALLLAVLSIPYIINGANLPGLWYFIPLIAGLILFLFCLLSFILNQKKLAILYSIFSMVFYPPIMVFALPMIVFSHLENREVWKTKKDLWITIGAIACVFAVASFFIFGSSNLVSFKDSILSMIFRDNLQSGIPRFNIFTIIPIWILILSLVGLFSQIKAKKYWLICLVAIGLAFWIVYSITQKVFIIEYQRVIIITSIIFTILAGLGLQYFRDFIHTKYQIYEKYPGSILSVVILIIFIILAPFYTRYTDWQKLVMQIGGGEDVVEVSPASPANIYLIPDDIRLFKDIKKEKFIAPPWKGLTIGVATNNFPLQSKSSTLTNEVFLYNNFISVSCLEKTKIAQKFQIAYAYSSPFSCPSFAKLGESEEGLVLYKVKIYNTKSYY